MATSSLVRKFARYFIDSDGGSSGPPPRPVTSFNRFSVERLHQSPTESFSAKLYPTEKGKFVAGLDKVKVKRSKSSMEPRSDSDDLDFAPPESRDSRDFRKLSTDTQGQGQSSKNVQYYSPKDSSKPSKAVSYKASDVYLRQSVTMSRPDSTNRSNKMREREFESLEHRLLTINRPKPDAKKTSSFDIYITEDNSRQTAATAANGSGVKLAENTSTIAIPRVTSTKYRYESSFSLAGDSNSSAPADRPDTKVSFAANGHASAEIKAKAGKTQTPLSTRLISSRSTGRSAANTSRTLDGSKQQQRKVSVRREEDCIALWFDELHNKRNKDKATK